MSSIPSTFGSHENEVRRESSESPLRKAMRTKLGVSATNPTYYTIFGLAEGEEDIVVIRNACDRVMEFLSKRQFGEGMKELRELVGKASVTLMDPDRKTEYDNMLRMRNAQQLTRQSVTTVVPSAVPVATAPIIVGSDARINRAAPQQGIMQKYKYAIAASAALTVASIGGLWATSSSGNGTNDQAAAKAELNPGKDEPPVTPVATQTAEVTNEEAAPLDDIQAEEEAPVLIDYAPVYPVAPEESAPPVPPVAPEPIQLAQAPQVLPPKIAATSTPQRRDLGGLAAGTDTDFNRVDVPQAELEDALKSLNENFAAANVTKILDLLTKPTITSSPARVKAVLEFAMTKAKASPDATDDANVFDAILGNAYLYQNESIQTHAIAILGTKVKKGELHEARELVMKLEKQPAVFPQEFIATQTMALFKAAQAKKGDVMLRILGQDLVNMGAITPRDAMMAEARDLREQSMDPAIKKPANADQALQLSIRMINLAKSGTNIDPIAAQALVDMAKKTAGYKYARGKEFLEVVGTVEASIATAKRTAEFTKVLESDPTNAAALQGRADLRLAQGDVEGALDDMEKSGNALAKQTRALRSSPKGNECYRCGLEWLKLASATMNGRKASMIVIADEMMKSAKSATDDKLDEFAIEAVNMKLAELGNLIREHDVTHVKVVPKTTAKQITSIEARPEWKSVMSDIDVQSSGSAEWSKRSDGVIVVKYAKNPKLTLPFKLSANKDFEEAFQFDVACTEGKGCIQFSVPLGNGATIVLNGWPGIGGASGITHIDGLTADKNEAKVSGMAVPAGNATIELRVRRNGEKGSIRVSVNGKKNVEWEGDISRLSPHKDFKSSEHIIVAPYEAGYELKDVRREVLTAPATSGARVQTMKPVIEVENTEPTKPKGLQEFEKRTSIKATWNKETGSWYAVTPIKIDYTQAVQTAAAYGANLVVIDSAEENAFVNSIAPGKKVFLGIVRGRDGWYKPDGTRVEYTNWGRGEGGNKSEFVAEITEGATWCDTNKTDTKSACFEFKPH